MEACAENNIELIILDRPNPNGSIDGPTKIHQLLECIGWNGLQIGTLLRMESDVTSPAENTRIQVILTMDGMLRENC
jgi:uncharacterized protein YbbC (DUF1343 family)